MADIQITFGASLQQLVEGVQGAKAAIEEFKSKVEAVAEVLTLGFGIEQVTEFIASMAELGEQTERTAAILGTSLKETQELGLMSRLAGGSSDQLARAMELLQVNLQKAQTGTGPAAAALQALGLSAKELVGLSLDQQIDKIADATSKFADGGNKVAIVRELFGRMGAEMIPMLDQGSAGMARMREEMEQTGAIVSGQTIKSLADLARQSTLTKAEITGLGEAIVGSLAAALKGTEGSISEFTSSLSALIQTGALSTLVWQEVIGFLKKLGAELMVIDQLVLDIATASPVKAWDDWNKGVEHAREVAKDAQTDISLTLLKAKMDLRDLMAAPEGGNKPQAPGLDLGAANATKGALQGFQDQMKLADDAFKNTQQKLSNEVKLHQLTYDQETAQLLDALEKRHAAENAAIDGELTLYARGTNEYNKAIDERILKDQQYKAEHDKIVQQAASQEQKYWDQAGSAITSAFNSQTKALLAGTESLSQAMQNIFADLVVKVINKLEEILIEDYIIKGVQIALFGPAGALPSFDVGTNYVASSGLAMIHAGESIVPAQGTGPFTGGGGGGAAGSGNLSVNFSGPVIGTQAWINSILPQLARGLQTYQNQNPSLA